jgi:pimeloyl-ACP methyl ester carboxylesterase
MTTSATVTPTSAPAEFAAAARDEWRGVGDDAGQDSEFWPASHAAACAVLAPMGDSIVLADDGHPANIEQPKAFNEALLGFLRAG